MAKQTLLQMTQNILSALDSDEITTITDTAEATQVVRVLNEVYDQMIANHMVPEHKELIQITSAGATAKVFMLIPAQVKKLNWIDYNKVESGDTVNRFSEVGYKSPAEFRRILTARDNTDTNIVSATDPNSGIALDMIRNDAAPTWWTSFDDQYICFDSYDAAVDASGLVGSKTLCWADVYPNDWTDDDTFIPDLDDNQFPFLLAEAKSVCFINLKQAPNSKAEQLAKRSRAMLQNDKYRTEASEKENTFATGPDYGRRRR